jgi:hypothetical protein
VIVLLVLLVVLWVSLVVLLLGMCRAAAHGDQRWDCPDFVEDQ